MENSWRPGVVVPPLLPAAACWLSLPCESGQGPVARRSLHIRLCRADADYQPEGDNPKPSTAPSPGHLRHHRGGWHEG